jgi:hypothetical protein
MSPLPPREYLRRFYPDFDITSQLDAIREMLKLYKEQSDRRSARLDEHMERVAEAEVDRQDWERRARAHNEAGEYFHQNFYMEAAYSMGALGMLAPFVETVFVQGFQAIGPNLQSPPTYPPHGRWLGPNKKQWDCRFVFNNGKFERDIAKGIAQISHALGLTPKFPNDFDQRIEALFLYRNRVFHDEFEWPNRERLEFESRIKSLPIEWFDKAEKNKGHGDEEVWLFYLSNDFIGDAVATIEAVLDGMGSFVDEERRQGRLR